MQEKKQYKCIRCSEIIEAKKQNPTAIEKMAKWGAYGGIAFLAYQFLALFLVIAGMMIIDEICSSGGNSGGSSKIKCKKCGCDEFQAMGGAA